MATSTVVVDGVRVMANGYKVVIYYNAGCYEAGDAGAVVPDRIATAEVQATTHADAVITQRIARAEVEHGT